MSKAYVVLAHTNAFLQSVPNLTEVLCHEIGHTLGLDHSSEADPEPNPVLNQAIMFWMAHGNNWGAKLNSFDTNACRQIHPLNTPPWTATTRFLDVSSLRLLHLPQRPGVNAVQARGYDLQNTS